MRTTTQRTPTPASTIKSALKDYADRSLTTEEISERYGICQATLTAWVKRSGMKLRSRGRRKLEEPTPQQRKIIELARHQTYARVGARFGKHKQSVHRLLKRWSNWNPPTTPPYQPGDVVLWHGKELTVVSSAVDSGHLVDEKTGETYRNFTWPGRRLPKRVGFSKKYAKTSKPLRK